MTMNEPCRSRSESVSRWVCRAPLLVAALLICVVTGLNFNRLVRAHAPRNPWEAIQVLEAWRSAHGLPVYELAPDGHSTQVYGALVPLVQGEIFRWVGTNNISGRVVTLASALATVTMLAVCLSGRRSAWYLLIAWAALLAVNHRTCQYFSENRPDMTAMMFGTAGLLLIGSGLERRRIPAVISGSICLVVGFFFKQTVAVFAAVPSVALILRGRRPTRAEIILAILPMAATIGAILGLKVFSSTVYHYMIESQRSFAIDWPDAPKRVWELLAESPLFLVLLGEWILVDAASLRNDPRVLWLMAVLAVAIPFCAIAYAKVGGAPNAMLPALLAIIAFCALRLPRLLERLDDPRSPLYARAMFGSLLTLLLLMTLFPRTGVRAYEPAWDATYWETVGRVAQLPGKVVCPEDPTIPLYAKRHAGRSLYGERDTHLVDGRFPRALPDSVRSEFSTADYVIDIDHYWEDHVNDRMLRDLGFVPADGVAQGPGPYRMWRRKGGTLGPDPSRTALNEPDGDGPDRPVN
jgi:hypothetical protein